MVIGTSSGFLYHCIAIENDSGKDQSDAFQETYNFTTSNGINLIIPEVILYVFETIELSFPLTSFQENEICNTNDLNTSLQLVTDVKDSRRYFCTHSFGAHIVLVSFLKQLQQTKITEFHDEKAIVEYLICTRPTATHSPENSDPLFPVGIVLILNHGFTYVTVLLNSAELVSKRLTNITIEDSDPLFVNNSDIDLGYLLDRNCAKKSIEQKTSDSPNKKPSFSEHLEKILAKNNLPLIKTSKPKDSSLGSAELEMLINSIDVFKKEYIEKFKLATKVIQKRKNVLKDDCKVQVSVVYIT